MTYGDRSNDIPFYLNSILLPIQIGIGAHTPESFEVDVILILPRVHFLSTLESI